MSNGTETQNPSRNRDEFIREQAHAIWLERGRPEGQDLEHWMEAERRFGPEAPQAALEENTSVLGADDGQKPPGRTN